MKNSVKRNRKNCVLLLDDGSYFLGQGSGYFGDFLGEICFNTSITGYQEILTDPSYFNQIINFTFPHIGVVGTNLEDYESDKIYASGCIINNPVSAASNFRSKMDFENWLQFNKKVCVSNIDTRALTKRIRNSGACKALIHYPENGYFENMTNLKTKLMKFPSMKNLDLASEISTNYKYKWFNKKKLRSFKINKNFIAVIDFGIKKNILNILSTYKYDVVVFPYNFSVDEIIKMKPSGLFLSNGPGDPLATFKRNEENLCSLKKFNKPIFGICLGHQILSLIYSARTEKMHHGHRGANHPIKNVKTKKVEITVQNHGFVVSKKSFPDNLSVTHTSLFDNTIAGIEVKNKPFFSVQYHPESSPGPQDSRYLFDQFFKLITKCLKEKI